MNNKTTYIKSELVKLSNILNSIHIDELRHIKDLQYNFFKRNEYSSITEFIIDLAQLRNKLKIKINKYERAIIELDKQSIEKKIYKKKNKNIISNKLYQLHKANDTIKIALKNIILKIK